MSTRKRCSQLLAELPDDQFITVGTYTGWIWFGTVKQAWEELPKISEKWYSYFFQQTVNAVAAWNKKKDKYTTASKKYWQGVMSTWEDFQDRPVRSHYKLLDIPSAGMKGGIAIKLTGHESGVYWSYGDWLKDPNRWEPKESGANNVRRDAD